MKSITAIASLLCAGLLAGCATQSNHPASLASQAKISRAEAERTALERVPNGTIKEAELEKEHGKLIWSFDIRTPDSRDIQEVAVNAITGEVVSVETETPGQQAKEAAEDAKKPK